MEAQKTLLRSAQRKEGRKSLKNVQVLTDNDGILWLKSRIANEDELSEFIAPLILPPKHLVINQFIEQEHLVHKHIICGHVSSIQRARWFKELQNKGIQCTDIGKSSMTVELLIVTDYAANLFTGNICHLSSGLIAVETYLRWNVMGSPKVASNNYSSISLCIKS
ncbi:DUF1758 domain-containing protein [Trichonephila clavata]|uniref:DUF1758 domain-containing protein n=1 Tax=Trichonephila clavata TaxID=2740835 RepID=A0A8X6GMX0_TRICU|nr:DUF1758 domain-containing protein [Trichonephila clavata]